MNEEEEVEYYEEDPRVYVCTTRSGRKVYSVPRLIVPIPNNDEDLAELETYDETYGSDCEEDLSERSGGGEEEGGGGDSDYEEGEGGDDEETTDPSSSEEEEEEDSEEEEDESEEEEEDIEEDD